MARAPLIVDNVPVVGRYSSESSMLAVAPASIFNPVHPLPKVLLDVPTRRRPPEPNVI